MCRVDGCFRPPTKFSHLCEYHRNVDRVHGHPLQKAVTKSEVRPYEKAVRQYLDRKSGPRVQAVIERDWNRVVRDAEEFIEAGNRGRVQNTHQRRAMKIVVDIAKDVPAIDIGVLLMAMGFLYADQPRRWASDEGFQFQAARMLRRLARGETSYTWQPDGRMVRSSAKRCPQAVMRALWVLIYETNFIGYGVQIRGEIEKGRALKQKDRIADLREILGPTSTIAKGQSA